MRLISLNVSVVHQFEFLILLSELRESLCDLSVNTCYSSFNAEDTEEDAEFAEKPSEQHIISN